MKVLICYECRPVPPHDTNGLFVSGHIFVTLRKFDQSSLEWAANEILNIIVAKYPSGSPLADKANWQGLLFRSVTKLDG